MAGWRIPSPAFYLICRIFGNPGTSTISPRAETLIRLVAPKKYRRKSQFRGKGFFRSGVVMPRSRWLTYPHRLAFANRS